MHVYKHTYFYVYTDVSIFKMCKFCISIYIEKLIVKLIYKIDNNLMIHTYIQTNIHSYVHAYVQARELRMKYALTVGGTGSILDKVTLPEIITNGGRCLYIVCRYMFSVYMYYMHVYICIYI